MNILSSLTQRFRSAFAYLFHRDNLKSAARIKLLEGQVVQLEAKNEIIDNRFQQLEVALGANHGLALKSVSESGQAIQITRDLSTTVLHIRDEAAAHASSISQKLESLQFATDAVPAIGRAVAEVNARQASLKAALTILELRIDTAAQVFVELSTSLDDDMAGDNIASLSDVGIHHGADGQNLTNSRSSDIRVLLPATLSARPARQR